MATKKESVISEQEVQEIVERMGRRESRDRTSLNDFYKRIGLEPDEPEHTDAPGISETGISVTEETAEEAANEVLEEAVSDMPGKAAMPQRRISSKQRKLSLDEYRTTYLHVPKIADRKPVFVSGKVRDSLFFFYVILMLMPYQVTLVPNYLVSDWLHLLNTRWAIFLPGAFAPFSVFLLTKFMRRIPMAVIESAKIDGANEWHIFWNICLPQCRSALYSIAILVFIDNWNMVEQPLILLNDVEKQPLSMFLSSINAGEIGIAFAAAVIYMIPGLLLFLHGEAYLVEGIAHSGSVKG